MFKLDLEKAEEPGIKLPTSVGSSKKARKFQRNIYFCFIDYTKVFDYVEHNKLWKFFQEMGIPGYCTYLLRNLYAGQKAGLELEMEQWTDSKLASIWSAALSQYHLSGFEIAQLEFHHLH